MKNSQVPRPPYKFSTLFRLVPCVGALILIVSLTAAQEKIVKLNRVAPTYTNPNSGSEMFATYCSACHGVKGQGNGPAAPAFNKRPTDLTLLAESHGGKFPRMLVSSTLQQGPKASANGSAGMPILYDTFRHLDSMNQGAARLRINNLTDYIESLQAK